MLPPLVQNIISRLEENGYEAYAVGGAVRDFLLKKTPTDWDIATSAKPLDVIDIFGKENCIPTGINHGTVTYAENKSLVEITTFRIDGKYEDNRRPKSVTFSESINEDLSRRDFTINAMAYNQATGIIDPFCGQADLNLKVIRTVGEASTRFKEDGLRIIRGLRFAAVLDFKIDPNTAKAIHQHKSLLNNIAKERIAAELSKLVLARNPEHILAEFEDVFKTLLGIDSDFIKNRWSENLIALHRTPKTLSVRLAVLLSGASEKFPPHKILRRLKFDNKTITNVKTISDFLDKEILADRIYIKNALSKCSETVFRSILAARCARFPSEAAVIKKAEDILNEIISTKQCYLKKDLQVDGNDLIKINITGAQIGTVLDHLLNEVIAERCENKKESLIALAEKLK